MSVRASIVIVAAALSCGTASGEDLSDSWSAWWRGCTPEALSACLKKAAGTSKQVALEMAYECKVRFDRGYRFHIQIDESGASTARYGIDQERFKSYGFKGHRAILSIDKTLLIDEVSGAEIVDGDFRGIVSDKTNRHIFDSANELIASKGICEKGFDLPKPNGSPRSAGASPTKAPAADRGAGSAEEKLNSTAKKLIDQAFSDSSSDPDAYWTSALTSQRGADASVSSKQTSSDRTDSLRRRTTQEEFETAKQAARDFQSAYMSGGSSAANRAMLNCYQELERERSPERLQYCLTYDYLVWKIAQRLNKRGDPIDEINSTEKTGQRLRSGFILLEYDEQARSSIVQRWSWLFDQATTAVLREEAD